MSCPNSDLRLRIVDLVCSGGGGHIPSSFSIIDILDCVYSRYIGHHSLDHQQQSIYSFTLSKGHAACALYCVLHKYLRLYLNLHIINLYKHIYIDIHKFIDRFVYN